MRSKICGCGPIHTVTLTDARIIQRFQDYICGCKGDHVDSMLFLSDISSIKDRVEGRPFCRCRCSCASCVLLLCFPIEFLCCFCRCCCSSDIPVPISLNGAFGIEVFTFSHHVANTALSDIPAAAMPHKISSHKPSIQML